MASQKEVVECFAKLEDLCADKAWLNAVVARYLYGTPCDEEPLYEVTGAIFRLLTGPDAARWPVYDKLGREWRPAEIDAAHDILDWITAA